MKGKTLEANDLGMSYTFRSALPPFAFHNQIELPIQISVV